RPTGGYYHWKAARLGGNHIIVIPKYSNKVPVGGRVRVRLKKKLLQEGSRMYSGWTIGKQGEFSWRIRSSKRNHKCLRITGHSS
ncbi:MAG: hypothetical protein WBM35_16480, partial [Candidatus Electrothrix sp.]